VAAPRLTDDPQPAARNLQSPADPQVSLPAAESRYVKKQTGGVLRALPEVDERRQHQRIEPQGATVDLTISGQPVAFAIDNLSEGGALVAGRIALDPTSAFELSIQLPGAAPIPIWARVLRYVPRGGQEYTALLFLSSSEALAEWISEVVLQGLRAAFPEL
jgi:hypothetical protein